MLKTSISNKATPAVLFIAYGVLKGYAKNPLRLFIKILLKVPKLKKQLPKKLSNDIKKQAAIIASMYIVLKEKVEKERALSTVQAVITPVAIAVQLGNFRYAETDRSFEKLKKYHEMAISESPTRSNIKEIIESSDEKYHFRVKSCLHMGLFKRLGVPELTRIMCNVDNALYNIYSPDKVLFHRNGPGHTIFEGCKYCEFICENKEVKPVL
ncbi:MAG: L-2-amino-thiazoline-4-carboxylic acid hydrolase [Candidatus Auribacterota bacterium]|nr:L-2-amino-thiazoline-4-carboxylic acid hydrolase [Candidatus Auribacterota bacterium]